MDRGGSSVHGIFSARGLEWVAISFSRESSRPRDWTQVSCIEDSRFTVWATREVYRPEKWVPVPGHLSPCGLLWWVLLLWNFLLLGWLRHYQISETAGLRLCSILLPPSLSFRDIPTYPNLKPLLLTAFQCLLPWFRPKGVTFCLDVSLSLWCRMNCQVLSYSGWCFNFSKSQESSW